MHTKVRASEQERAAADVVRRLFPTRHDEFQVHIVPTFRVGPHQLEKFRVHGHQPEFLTVSIQLYKCTNGRQIEA